ncbi:MAG: transketolase [Acidiferrobacterales bacterium]|nr:transketolase [Acidiferrobacterales bacterium]
MTNISRRQKANAIRALSMDAVQQAKSGHPGAPMGMADIAEVLWSDYLKHSPANPDWVNRDRFVLSNGHGSMLIYSLLHLTGYDLDIDEIRNFRQLHSKTPGHPEYGYTPGVETTTGPLGQGITNAVGMALAERTLAAQFNRPEHSIIDHHTWAFLGDGCLMEGISHEACSLAGTLGLGKLIAFYDDNGISIDGEVQGWFTDDTVGRFEAYGWQVVPDVDGHDPEVLRHAIEAAKNETSKPTLICCKTTIGFGSPNKAGTGASHGAPLGEEEVELTRKELDWPHPAFEIPAEIKQQWDARESGKEREAKWNQAFAAYQSAYPDLAAELQRRLQRELPADWVEKSALEINRINEEALTIATRKASLNSLNALGPLLPELLGGSADLAGSNYSIWSGSTDVQEDHAGNYVYFGVREFAMSAIVNGMILHGGFKAYGATFLMFSEYARNALRMAALMKIPSLFLFTHDSIGVGEDGPTHQPVEQTATLRMIPGMSVWRPCDAVESVIAWQQALASKDQPFSLIFSRQNSAHQERNSSQIENVARGGYILRECEGEPEAVVIATGTEVELATAAAEALPDRRIQVVSMPSTDRFDTQDEAYRESVLPSGVTKRLAIEAGVTAGWWKYVGHEGLILGIDSFGESAPASEVYKHLGITVESAIDALRTLLAKD